MSYYITRAIKVLKNSNMVSVQVACNNVKPIKYWTDRYGDSEKTKEENLKKIGISIQQGNFQGTPKATIYGLGTQMNMREMEHMMNSFSKLATDVTFDSDLTYKCNFTNRVEEVIAEEFFVPMCLGKHVNSERLVNRIDALNEEAKKGYRKALEDDLKNDRVRICCAIRCNYPKGYDCLISKDRKAVYLAKIENYNSGVLEKASEAYVVGTDGNTEAFYVLGYKDEVSCKAFLSKCNIDIAA